MDGHAVDWNKYTRKENYGQIRQLGFDCRKTKQMEVLNNQKVNESLKSTDEVGGDLLCILACGSVCLIGWPSGPLALEVSSVAVIC